MPDEEGELSYRWESSPTRKRWDAVGLRGHLPFWLMRRSALLQVGDSKRAPRRRIWATASGFWPAAGYAISVSQWKNLERWPLPHFSIGAYRPGSASLEPAAPGRSCAPGANPLRIQGLSLWQRIAYLEGILHWFNVDSPTCCCFFFLALDFAASAFGLLGVAT